MFKKNLRKFSLLLALIFLAMSLSIIQVRAEMPSGEIDNPLESDDFGKLVAGIINWIAGIVVVVAILMVIIGGIQYMVSGGNEEKTTAARKTIQWALIGLFIVLASWSLINEFLNKIIGVK